MVLRANVDVMQEQRSSYKAKSDSAITKFPVFYGTRKFIAVFIRARLSFLSRARWIQYIPSHPISLRSIIFPPTPRSSKWSLPYWLFNQNTVSISRMSHVSYMPRPINTPSFYHHNNIWWSVHNFHVVRENTLTEVTYSWKIYYHIQFQYYKLKLALLSLLPHMFVRSPCCSYRP
jgi:hypothetical protein